MTLGEAIERIDTLKENQYDPAVKVGWLSYIEGMVKNEIINMYVGGDQIRFNGYDAETDSNTVLIVPEPYSDLYIKWLQSQIDYWNGETIKYNNSISAFNQAYEHFRNYWNSQHEYKKSHWGNWKVRF